MTTSAQGPGRELHPAVRQMIDATNAEDSEAFLSAFAQDAVVDDWGRRFTGRAEIAAWNARENIGTHNRIEVTGVSPAGDDVVLTIQVSGDGYNGGGTFAIRTQGDTIDCMTILGSSDS